ncbi:unnamed protein product, partial [Ectocarpus sp. 4 AP-2014]
MLTFLSRAACSVCILALAFGQGLAGQLSFGEIVVADFGRDAIFRIDPITGNRTLMSGLGVGSGPSLLQPRGVAISVEGLVYVTD